jgi:uncharacterized membrane protein
MSDESGKQADKKQRPFRRAILRGLAVLMPPLLTVVFFVWMWHTIESYVLSPLESGAKFFLVNATSDSHDRVPADITHSMVLVVDKDGGNVPLSTLKKQSGSIYEIAAKNGARIKSFNYNGTIYVPIDFEHMENTKWIPEVVRDSVHNNPGDVLPTTVKGYYRRYVEIRYLQRKYVVPIFLVGFILVLYLVGKFMAAGVGRIFLTTAEGVIVRLPLIRTVYSAVKQVTDFAFNEREMEYTRIVALEYPRQGLWSIGFVTGESFLDIRSAANEPVLSVLMPTSPMPATGFTVTIPKSQTIDLNITVDQAIQFCVSCGVVIPSHQQYSSEIEATVSSAIAEHDGKQETNGGALSDKSTPLIAPTPESSDDRNVQT